FCAAVGPIAETHRNTHPAIRMLVGIRGIVDGVRVPIAVDEPGEPCCAPAAANTRGIDGRFCELNGESAHIAPAVYRGNEKRIKYPQSQRPAKHLGSFQSTDLYGVRNCSSNAVKIWRPIRRIHIGGSVSQHSRFPLITRKRELSWEFHGPCGIDDD